MEILTVQNNRVVPNPHALSDPPFKELWDRAVDKEVALAEFTYIEFMCSLKKTNPYKDYPPEYKAKAIARAAFGTDTYEPDELVMKCIHAYRKHLSKQLAVRMYDAAKEVAERLIRDMTHMDLGERTKSNAAVYKPIDITKAISESDKVLAALQSLEKKVEEDVYEKMKTKGDRRVNPLEL